MTKVDIFNLCIWILLARWQLYEKQYELNILIKIISRLDTFFIFVKYHFANISCILLCFLIKYLIISFTFILKKECDYSVNWFSSRLVYYFIHCYNYADDRQQRIYYRTTIGCIFSLRLLFFLFFLFFFYVFYLYFLVYIYLFFIIIFFYL